MTWGILKEYKQLVREENYSGSHMDRMIGSIAFLKRKFEFPELCTVLVFPDFDTKLYKIYREELSDTGARHFLTGVRKFREFLLQRNIISEIENPANISDHPADQFANYLRELNYNKSYSKEMARHIRKTLKSISFEELCSNFQDRETEQVYFEETKKTFNQTYSTRRIGALRLFKRYLIEVEEIEVKPFFPGPAQFAEIRAKIFEYLSVERQYQKETVEQHFRVFGYLERFLDELGVQHISEINQSHLIDYQEVNDHCRSYKKYLRNILAFLYRDGYLNYNFSYIILISKQKDNETRKLLSPEDIDRILETMPRDSSKEKRNYAIFLCMARMGFRIKETLALELADVDWINASIKIRGKQDKVSNFPLSKEVAAALLDYLKNSNRGDSPQLFLSMRRPFLALNSFRHFTEELRVAYEISGVVCPTSYVRLNVFRHSFGTEKLRDGVPMEIVRDLMRHERIDTTLIYAKYNFETLRPLVSDWPGASHV